MLFKLIVFMVILILAIFGVFLLLTPAESLITTARRGMFGIPLPIPKEGTPQRKLLLGFYRFIGIIALGFCVFVIFILFIH
jgi:hypothetical protein